MQLFEIYTFTATFLGRPNHLRGQRVYRYLQCGKWYLFRGKIRRAFKLHLGDSFEDEVYRVCKITMKLFWSNPDVHIACKRFSTH